VSPWNIRYGPVKLPFDGFQAERQLLTQRGLLNDTVGSLTGYLPIEFSRFGAELTAAGGQGYWNACVMTRDWRGKFACFMRILFFRIGSLEY